MKDLDRVVEAAVVILPQVAQPQRAGVTCNANCGLMSRGSSEIILQFTYPRRRGCAGRSFRTF